ncbi:MAG: Nif3-like dinuclear metal center hexameric protein [Bacteroidota bacterium]
MIRIKDIVAYLEQIAPLAYQEAYDNAGLVVGEVGASVTGVLICLDITEAVLQEAKAKACNLIIAHHPLIFRPIKRLTAKSYVEKCLAYAIKEDLAIYSLHTNLDNVAQGVNRQIAQTLGLQDLSILLPKPGTLRQLTTFVPPAATKPLLQALHTAGAGCIGDYTHCSFVTTGTGSFQPTAAATPHVGTPHQLEKVEEERIEVVFPAHLEASVLRALQEAHPYEEVAYYIQQLQNTDAQVGAGMVGVLPQPLSSEEFLQYLKTKMTLACIRYTAPLKRAIQRVAVCGGSGSGLIQAAIKQQADVLVTADVRYHDFFQAEGQLLIADIGHYESEVGTKALIHTLLSEKFASIALLQCETVTNPIHYL